MLTLSFEPFSWNSLRERAAEEEISLGELVSRAAAYLELDLAEARAAVRLPRGLDPDSGRDVRLGVTLAASQWAALEAEARRQAVPLERLLEHACLYYLAGVASGRVAELIARRAEAEE